MYPTARATTGSALLSVIINAFEGATNEGRGACSALPPRTAWLPSEGQDP